VRIRLIADGSTKWQRMLKRWGIAFLIDEDILFDTFGDDRIFMRNVRKQKIDLSKIKHIVLSHDDWDHIAGLWSILKKTKEVKVYIPPHFKPEIKKRILLMGGELIETPGPMMIRENVYTTGELFKMSSRGIYYEQSLVLRFNDELSVVTGCAHPGIGKIVEMVRDHFKQDVGTLIGGFHMKDMEIERIKKIIQKVQGLGLGRVVPLHCTGSLAVKEFKCSFKENSLFLSEGDFLEV
jgi:7,8-dihydropterin-6-yl-methyl-4-(beta-D-ribofuranosyl)aminobenzene 5'-phosphate synthase